MTQPALYIAGDSLEKQQGFPNWEEMLDGGPVRCRDWRGSESRSERPGQPIFASLSLCRPQSATSPFWSNTDCFFYNEVQFSIFFLLNLLALISPGYLCTRIHKNTVVACSAPSSWKTCLFWLNRNQFHPQLWLVGDIVPAAGGLSPCCKSGNGIKWFFFYM